MTPDHKFTLLTTFGPAALSAVIAAVVSWLVTRAVLKNSPDYQQQLNDLRTEMGRVGAAQEGILAHYRELSADERSRREAAQWHPAMELRSDRQAMTNSLYIAADQHFRIDRIRIKTNSGAVVETLTGDPAQMGRMAEVLIPSQAIVELTQRDPDFLRNEKTVGKLECVLEVGIVPQQRTFRIRVSGHPGRYTPRWWVEHVAQDGRTALIPCDSV